MKIVLDLTPKEFDALHKEAERIGATTYRDSGRHQAMFIGITRKLIAAHDASTATVKDVKNCARCGLDHAGPIIAQAMTRPFTPPEAGGLAWTHWFPCPTNGEPVMVIVGASDQECT